jgi:hypothetical protein
MQSRSIVRRGLGRAAVALLCSLPLLTACSRALATDGTLIGSGYFDTGDPSLTGTWSLNVQQTGASISGTASLLYTDSANGYWQELDWQITSGDIAGEMSGPAHGTDSDGADYILPSTTLSYSTTGGNYGSGMIIYVVHHPFGLDDDFAWSITSGKIELTPTPSYSISLLYDPSRSVKSGAAYPIKIQVLNGGDNVSSADLAVTALKILQKDGKPDGDLLDTGNANPTYGFRYDASLGGYIYNVDTRYLLSSGTYVVQFTVGSSSQLYEASFNVK